MRLAVLCFSLNAVYQSSLRECLPCLFLLSSSWRSQYLPSGMPQLTSPLHVSVYWNPSEVGEPHSFCLPVWIGFYFAEVYSAAERRSASNGRWPSCVLLFQVYGCLQSPVGALSSKSKAALCQTSQNDPPGCGFEVRYPPVNPIWLVSEVWNPSDEVCCFLLLAVTTTTLRSERSLWPSATIWAGHQAALSTLRISATSSASSCMESFIGEGMGSLTDPSFLNMSH